MAPGTWHRAGRTKYGVTNDGVADLAGLDKALVGENLG